MSDLSLRNDVQEELAFEPSIDAAHIGVAVCDGVVTLTGHVADLDQKLAAERAARRVKGVRAIAQEIEVRFPQDKKTADDEIAARALNIIAWHAAVPSDRIQVKVQAGWVTLSGSVDWQYQSTRAEEAVRQLSGVVDVSNRIVIRPKLAPIDIQHQIEKALRRNLDVEAERVHVQVAGGKVILEGKVRDWRERDAATLAAWGAPGVSEVVEHLSIIQP